VEVSFFWLCQFILILQHAVPAPAVLQLSHANLEPCWPAGDPWDTPEQKLDSKIKTHFLFWKILTLTGPGLSQLSTSFLQNWRNSWFYQLP